MTIRLDDAHVVLTTSIRYLEYLRPENVIPLGRGVRPGADPDLHSRHELLGKLTSEEAANRLLWLELESEILRGICHALMPDPPEDWTPMQPVRTSSDVGLPGPR